MLDHRNRELAEVTQADDFIVSDRLISLMLSQLSENEELNAVFDELFNPEGSEVYLSAGVALRGARPPVASTPCSAAAPAGADRDRLPARRARASAADGYGVASTRGSRRCTRSRLATRSSCWRSRERGR